MPRPGLISSALAVLLRGVVTVPTATAFAERWVMRWRQYGIVGFVLLIAVLPGPRVAGAEQAPTETTAPEVGALAPDFVLPDLNGTMVRLADYRGKKCAGAQGQFWPYHDRLFAVQGRLAFTRKNLLHMAQELHLDLTDFTACLDTGRFTPQVRAETRATMALGLRGTPGFIINGRSLVGALPFELFQSVIEEALATTASGTSPVPQAGQPAPPPPAK